MLSQGQGVRSNLVSELRLQVLVEDKSNAKALFRRGKARLQLQQTEEAQADLQAAAKLAPGDRAIAQELQAVRQNLRADHKAQSRMYKGRLKPDPEPSSQGTQLHTGMIASLLASLQSFFGSLQAWVLRR